MELVKKSFIVLILLMIIPVVTSIEVGITDGEPQIGIDLIPDTPGFNNNTGSVNDTTFWQGYTPTTYYDSIKLLFDATYCLLVGCTMQGDIDMNDNQILDAGNIISNENITADTYFGDWNGGNVDGNINILRSDNPSLTLVLSYIGGIARIGTDGNDNFRFITNGIDRVKIEEDGDMIVTNNITADTYFGDGSELTGIESEYNQTKKVCKEGCKYSTIQSAMDSITDASATNVYTVLLYPGIYNENVIQTSYVNLKGVGLRGNSIINISSGVGYNIVGQGSIDSITIQSVSQTDNSVVLYNQSSGKHHIKNCKLKFESSDNGRSGKWFGVNGGELTVTGNELDYDVDGNAGGLVLQNPIMVTNGELNLLDNEITMELEDTDDWLVLINSVATASTETHISNNIIEIEATNVGFNGLMTAWYEHGIGGEKFLQNNHVHLTGQAGGSSICVGAFFDSSDNDATLNGNSNWIDVAGCNTNTGVTMNAGDTLVSSFDRVNAVTPISGAGNFNYVQSPSDGNFAVSGNITTADNSYSKLGNLWICNYTLTSNLTKSIEEGLC